MLLLASLATPAAGPAADLETSGSDGMDCEFLEINDEFPFVHVDPDCPPQSPAVAAAF